jgi:hypothetical protein
MGWGYNHISNNEGKVMVPGSNLYGQCVKDKIVVYPTVLGSTVGSVSLYFKCKVSKVGPAGFICHNVHYIDMAGAIASEIPAVDSLEADPLQEIQSGDWVEIQADEIGKEATVTITYKGASRPAAIRTSRPAAMQKKSLKLNRYEQEMLDGKHGEAKQYCMKKMYDFGLAVEAEEMVPVSLIINACPIYLEDLTDRDFQTFDMGHSPLYLPIFKSKDGKTVCEEPQCHPCNDPFLLQIDKYEEEGYLWNFSWGTGKYKIPKHIYEAYARGYRELQKHGWINTCSCQTQMNMCPPKFGEYCASSESSCASYINSIIGGRTNRENSIMTVYAAYTGCIPKYGTMLDENRRPVVIVKLTDEVRDNMKDPADWSALGAVIAEKASNRIPAVLNLPRMISNTAAKYITGCVSPGMNDPMLHLIGLSPESPTLEAAFGGKVPANIEKYEVTLADVREEYNFLNTVSPAKSDKVDIVIMGCPHLTYDEVREIARLVDGKKVKSGVHLWVQTDVASYHLAHEFGDAKKIEDAGGKIYHSACMAMNPMHIWSHDLTIATNSFKYVKLAGGFGQKWIYGTVPDLINSAVTGKFVQTRW